MLVLTIRDGAPIYVGDNVAVHLVKIKSNGSVQLGFEAPRSIQIVRADAKCKQPKVALDTEPSKE